MELRRLFLIFSLSLCFLLFFPYLSLAVNSYFFSLNLIRVDVKGNKVWESKALIRVDDPSSFFKSIVWRYNPEVTDLAVERLRLKRADGRVELLAMDVKDYGSLVEKRVSLEGLSPGDMIEISFSLMEKSLLSPYFWFHLPYPQGIKVNKLSLEVRSPVGFSSNEAFLSGVLEKEGIEATEPFSPLREPLLLTSLPSWGMASSLFSPKEEDLSIKELEERLSRVPSKRGKLELLWKILSDKRVLEGWDFADQGYRFSSLKKVWSEREVTPSDLSFFVYSFLKKLGLSPEMVWVSQWPLSEKYAVPSMLSHPLVKVVVDDKTYWLDPYALGLPVGYIHPRFQGGKGIIFSFNEFKFVSVPLLSDSLSSEEVNMSVDLAESGDYNFEMTGTSKGWLSDRLKRFSDLKGVSEFKLESKGLSLEGQFKGKGSLFVDSFGDRMVISIPRIDFPLEFLSLTPNRNGPIDLGFLRKFEHKITLKYPRRWRPVSLPLPLSREEESFSLSAKFLEVKKNTITLSYSFRLKKKILSPEEWVSLRKSLALLEDYISAQLLFERR